MVAVSWLVLVAVTCGELTGVTGVGVCAGGSVEDFWVAVGLLVVSASVFCGVRNVCAQTGGVSISGKTGSITNSVRLSAIYCALGSNFESMLACTFHCGARPIASVPVRDMQTNPSNTIARNNIQSRFRCFRLDIFIFLQRHTWVNASKSGCRGFSAHHILHFPPRRVPCALRQYHAQLPTQAQARRP